MKITIAYLPEEERSADTIKTFVEGVIPGIRVRKSDRHAPFKPIYLTVKIPVENEKRLEGQRFLEIEESP